MDALLRSTHLLEVKEYFKTYSIYSTYLKNEEPIKEERKLENKTE